LNKIAESKEIERRSYEHWVEEYVRAREEYVSKLEKVSGEIFNLDTELAALNKRINNATNERDE
jgi:serine protease inhibitor